MLDVNDPANDSPIHALQRLHAADAAQTAATALGRDPAEPGTLRLAEAIRETWRINDENWRSHTAHVACQVAQSARSLHRVAASDMARGAGSLVGMKDVRRESQKKCEDAANLMACLARIDAFCHYCNDVRLAGAGAVLSPATDGRYLTWVANDFVRGVPAEKCGESIASAERDHADTDDDVDAVMADLEDGMNDD